MLFTGTAFLQTWDLPDRDLLDNSWHEKEKKNPFFVRTVFDIKGDRKRSTQYLNGIFFFPSLFISIILFYSSQNPFPTLEVHN